MLRQGIKDDRHTPLQDIKQDLEGSISSELVKIQNHKLHTEDEWLEYVEGLPCVIVPAVQERESEPEPKRRRANNGNVAWLPERDLEWERIDAFEYRSYAAVSYRWNDPNAKVGKTRTYRCMPVGRPRLKQCPVRDQVIDRVLNFVRYKKRRFFWIDQICLNQFDNAEKQIQMRSMHAVYRKSNFPVAILSVCIQFSNEMDLLFRLVNGSLLDHAFTSSPSEKYIKATSAVSQALELIERIIDDPWWKSAWTYEEDHCAEKMTLLIRHSSSLNLLKNRPDIKKRFGSLKNELCISSKDFRTGVNQFCLMYKKVCRLPDYEKNACEAILAAAPKYSILLRGKDNKVRVSMSPYILADLAERRIQNVSDSIIVASNCCDYSTGISVNALNKRWSLSLVMLALYILNGEILSNSRTTRCSLEAPVFEYLKKQSLQTHQPPINCKPLTFIKSARLSVAELTKQGVVARGHLWELSEVFEVSIWNSSRRFEEDSANGLNGYQRRRLKDLALALKGGAFGNRYRPLANGICSYLSEDKSPSRRASSWKAYMDIMAEELVEALRLNKPLRLGRLVDESDERSSYLAIFIWNLNAEDDETHVFTSFEEGQRCWKDVQKHVSIGVDVDEGTRKLYTRNWRNGMIFTAEEFFTREEQTSTFLFPWPPALKRE